MACRFSVRIVGLRAGRGGSSAGNAALGSRSSGRSTAIDRRGAQISRLNRSHRISWICRFGLDRRPEPISTGSGHFHKSDPRFKFRCKPMLHPLYFKEIFFHSELDHSGWARLCLRSLSP
jgi:hypothetical protein